MREAGLEKIESYNFIYCPCALLMLMAKLKRTGNCMRLNWNGKSKGMIGLLGMETSSPAACPVIIVASMIFGISYLIQSLVPLKSGGG
ncbi:hypothetical protein AVEN_226947-1 [Araneus ventricosus]|uniref:Uncharacterized protein n=1 Tax=Araneus ventricosus TaxID=182803 RepID=A0A4Y2JGE2_ARAVE|nr:hypothetical protein AVEN_226947-1 [Araneus ventricosus]